MAAIGEIVVPVKVEGVEEVRRLGVKPGEMLLVTVPSKTPPDVVEHIAERFRRALPDDIKVLIVTGDIDVSVVAQEKTA